jgi:D-alanyl-lipoteichoic acid acyltransferase DltB (MBOAT superfamily)
VLFNSYPFLFAFLPLTLLAFHAVRYWWSRRVALDLVAAASLFFYGYWDPRYLALLIPSLVGNYWLGEQLARTRQKRWLILGLVGNLSVIGWFKYSRFFYEAITLGGPAPSFMRGIVLPLGISFITFQKIAYLVDIWRGHPKAESFDRWAFFVLFFPQLIAGPIVLFRQIDRQLRRPRGGDRYLPAAFQVGLMLFSIGLFKKVVLADSLGRFADDVFAFAGQEYGLSFRDAWLGAVSYSLQLYFDFSGYSDMAIGLGRMFGLRLPTNFNSPYQATNIIDFWRRWHMTLTAFFRDYVYIPLGGNRDGLARQSLYILIVFFLTGLWHGAGWTFVLWGMLHGVAVLVNHLWRRWVGSGRSAVAARALSRGLTLGFVVCGWVIFRAPTLLVAKRVLKSMFLLGGRVPVSAFPDLNLYPVVALFTAVGTAIVLAAPNSQRIVHRLRRERRRTRAVAWRWMPALVTGGALYFAISGIGTLQTKFIYFNF